MSYRNPYYDSQHFQVAATRFEERALDAKRYHAAITIQRLWRGYRCRHRYRRYRARAVGLVMLIDAATQTAAAAKIQSQWRAHQSRKLFEVLKAEALAGTLKGPRAAAKGKGGQAHALRVPAADDVKIFTACMHAWMSPSCPWDAIINNLTALASGPYAKDKTVGACIAAAKKHKAGAKAQASKHGAKGSVGGRGVKGSSAVGQPSTRLPPVGPGGKPKANTRSKA